MKGHKNLGAGMETKILALTCWIGCLTSALSEYALEIDFPLTPPLWLAIGICVLLVSTAQAQFTMSIKTNTINGVVSNWVGNGTYVVGSNTFKDVLQVINGGVLSNGLGFLGYETSASNNVAILNNGIWRNQDLYVGYNGSGNQLTVTNGGKVFSILGELGISASSSNNVAVVSGTGSVWSNEVGLYIGSSGSGNQLIVTNGGNVLTGDSFVGRNASSSNNVAVVTGSGSVWSNATVLFLGYDGGGNRLIVTNGGKIFTDGGGILGYDASSSKNVAVVTGPGSVWSSGAIDVGYFAGSSGNQLIVTNGGTVIDGNGIVGVFFGSSSNSVRVVASAVWQNNLALYVGLSGGSNELTIDGGSVLANNSAIISSAAGSGGNVIRVDSGSLFVTNAAGSGALVVSQVGAGKGELILNGGSITADNLIATNGLNSVITFNGGTITAGSALVNNGQDFVIGAVTNATYVPDGGTHFFSNNFVVRRGALMLDGGTVTVNQLVLTNATGVVNFNGGQLNTAGTSVTNGQQFVVGDGATGANLHLLGGVHSFANGLRIRNASTLTGCGTVNGTVVVDPGGTVFVDCGKLTFTGTVTNNYAMAANNYSVLESSGTLVNNGAILLYNGGTTNFHGTFINNGVISNAGWVAVSENSRSGDDEIIRTPSVLGFRYQLQASPSLVTPVWANIGASQSGTDGVLTFTDPGGATNAPSRFYRVDVIAP